MRDTPSGSGTIIRRLITFAVGFGVFFSGAAIANEVSVSQSEEQFSAMDEVPQQETQNAIEEYDDDARVLCSQIGKGVEDSSCFCVEGEVSDESEVDCLIASGVVPPEEKETYLRNLGIIPPDEILRDPKANQPQCSEIGKSNELDDDCFCVAGEVSDQAEIDCLLASGISLSGPSQQCNTIGKENELDGDCFCVEGEVSDMTEVDCLISSGLIPPSSRNTYLLNFE
jgi:hypothetical protein